MVSDISKINVCKILFLKHANCQVIELVRLQLPYLNTQLAIGRGMNDDQASIQNLNWLNEIQWGNLLP